MAGGLTTVKALGVSRRLVTCRVWYNGTSNPASYYSKDVSSVVRNSQGNHTVTFRHKGLKVIGVASAVGLSAAVAGQGVIVQVDNEGSATSTLAVTVLTHTAAAASVDPAANADNWFSVTLDVEDSRAG